MDGGSGIMPTAYILPVSKGRSHRVRGKLIACARCLDPLYAECSILIWIRACKRTRDAIYGTDNIARELSRSRYTH